MTKILRAAALCGLALVFSAPAAAQNLSLRAPAWATPLLAADIISTTGGRAALAADGIDLSVRITIAPPRGGVARVIRYDLRGNEGQLAVRRFTGHPSTGWWLWGPDAPRVTPVPAAQQREIAELARAAIGVGGAVAANAGETCSAGEQAFIELAVEGRSTSVARGCVTANDVAGRLATRLSELAGSRTEEELSRAAVTELLDADRAFSAMAAAEGVPAAFNAFAAENAVVMGGGAVAIGRAAIAVRYQNWPQTARLEWAPESARVSARGDMGWTWGNYTYVGADNARETGRYITVWTRDVEGNWRYAFDAPVQ